MKRGIEKGIDLQYLANGPKEELSPGMVVCNLQTKQCFEFVGLRDGRYVVKGKDGYEQEIPAYLILEATGEEKSNFENSP
jgi:hypothetical protein